MASKGKFYITTPIYYVNDVPHIGHAFEVIGIDVQARFRRLIGHDVMFLSGTDEHGQKVAQRAAANGVSPQEWTDRIAAEFERVWALLGISQDDFIRTTQKRHHETVAKLWNDVLERGDIYLGKYEGWYDVKEESFITESEMRNQGLEPGERIKRMSEDAYFFRLAKYREPLLKYIEENPDFIQPETRKTEVINSFLTPDMPDLCVSRTSIDWGIPVPNAPGHVMYVWFDALTNYLSGIGYGRDDSQYEKYWPADCHVIGKDILKFHCVYWPAMLMAGGVEPPKQVFGHGFITVLRPGASDGEKMSKSAGNAVDPLPYVEMIGAEPLRYLLMRQLNYGGDGLFSEEAMISTYNAEMPNGYGNLLSRTASMVEKNLGGQIGQVADEEMTDVERGFVTQWAATVTEYERAMPLFEFQSALESMSQFLDVLNKSFNDVEPWKLAKDPAQSDRLRVYLSCVSEGIRGLALLVSPFMPESAAKMNETLGLTDQLDWETAKQWGAGFGKLNLRKGEPLFKKLE